MSPRFLDTNVLLYSISNAPAEQAKCEVARGILQCRDLVLSIQVLQEFYVQATRTTRSHPLSHQLAVGLMRTWRRFPVQSLTFRTLDLALELCSRHRLAYWDAAILASAAEAGCSSLLTEDLQPGLVVAGVEVVNPFA